MQTHYSLYHELRVPPETIRNSINLFQQALATRDADSLFSVNRIQSRFYDINTNPINHDPQNLIPTQDLEPWFEENSCFYLFTRKSFYSSGARIGSNPMIYPTPKLESVDIDTEEDWSIAEAIMRGI